MNLHEKPIFSIIIPTYNRHKQIIRCIEACCPMNYPLKQIEIIVVNDGGKQPIEINNFQKVVNITVIKQPNAGPAAARNLGATKAKGKFLAFTDDIDNFVTAG